MKKKQTKKMKKFVMASAKYKVLYEHAIFNCFKEMKVKPSQKRIVALANLMKLAVEVEC